MNNKKSDSPVTHSELKAEIDPLRNEIKKLDHKVNRIGLELLKTQDEVKEIKETMATKSDVNKIMDGLDEIMHRIETFDRKAVVHDHRINDHETRIKHLEKASSR